MIEWLKYNLFNFEMYGFLHWLMTVITILAVVLICKNKEKIRSWKHHDKVGRYIIATVLIGTLAIYYGDLMLKGVWNPKSDLPLDFCFISGLFFSFALLTNNKKIFKYVYFFSFAGPLPAILLPNLVGGIQDIIVWQFFLTHYFYILGSIYVLYILEWRVDFKDAIKALIVGNIYFLSIALLNSVWGSNYIMTGGLPAPVIRIFPFVKYLDYPIVWLEIGALLAFMISCIPLYLTKKSKNNQNAKREALAH